MRNIRDDVERRFGRPVPDLLWELVQGGYEGVDPDTRAADIAADIREIYEALIGSRRQSASLPDLLSDPLPGGSPPSPAAAARIRALSGFYAWQASANRDVTRFRELALAPRGAVESWVTGGREGPFPAYRLLDESEVGQWVKGHFAEEIGEKYTDAGEYLTSVFQQGGLATLDYIADGREHRQSVARHGTLGELATIADGLADSYRWRSSEATMFVLAGRTPEVQVYVGSAQIRHHEYSPLTRVTMTLDPALAPEHVMGIYIRLRNRLRSGGPPRTLSPKTYHLAGHVAPHVTICAAHPQDKQGPGRRPAPNSRGYATFIDPVPGHTWQTLRAGWNERCRRAELDAEWRYDRASNFTRDAQAAITGLLFPNWQPPLPD